MKILILCKRRPMGRDLLNSPYGRFYYLPKYLAEHGCDVTISLLSYKRDPNEHRQFDGIDWHSTSAIPTGMASYVHRTKKLANSIKPDWVISFSDTWYGIASAYIAKSVGAKLAIDAYDNYESYMPWNKPLHVLWQRSLSKADILTAPGKDLLEKLHRHGPQARATIIEMRADPHGFKPIDKIIAREKMNLPQDKKLIGYIGSLTKKRGSQFLLDSIETAKRINPDIELVLTGRPGDIKPPVHSINVTWIPDESMPYLINSLDIATVICRPNSFGDYSYPVKLCEAMACHTPVIATNTKSTSWMLHKKTDSLVNFGDKDGFSKLMTAKVYSEKVDYNSREGWTEEGKALHNVLSNTI